MAMFSAIASNASRNLSTCSAVTAVPGEVAAVASGKCRDMR